MTAGATAPLAGRRARAAVGTRATPFLLAGTAFWLIVAVVAWHTPIASDFGQHAAAVQRVRDDWRHPSNPLLKTPGDGSPYYSPYIVALGLIARLTGAAGRQVVRACGPVNLAVLVAGVGAYARTLSGRRMAPVYALLAFTLLWGTRGKEWSGFSGVWSLTRGASYPSTFAVGLALLLWAWTDRVARGQRARPAACAGLGALFGVLLLIHPITALAAAVGVVAVLAARQRDWSRPVAAAWALGVAAAFAVALSWPYFDVFTLAGDSTVDEVHRRLYLHPWQWYGLATVGLPALALRARVGREGRRAVAGPPTSASRPTTRRTDRHGITGIHALTQQAAPGREGRRAAAGPPTSASRPATRRTDRHGITGMHALTQQAALGREGRRAAAGPPTSASRPATRRTDRHGVASMHALAQRAGPGRTDRRSVSGPLRPGNHAAHRQALRDPLLLMFAADCLIAGYGWVSGHYTYGRVFALLLVPPQFALAVELAAAPPWTRLRALLAPLAALALCFGLVAQIGAVVPRRLLPVAVGHPSRWADYGWAADRIPAGGVLLTDGYRAGHVLPAYGVYLVAPAWPDPSTPAADRARRFADVAAYLSPGTSAAGRAAIVRRYGVGWLLLTPGQRVPYDGRLVATGPRTGERLIRLSG
ncbi:hypothetical protein [Streptomyces sp. CA-111067]|uniref:hypothetical protein n=1 Tax=Streptomyces sp. CA-111067 TaxID=3240046 RepID=UPI003D99B49B